MKEFLKITAITLTTLAKELLDLFYKALAVFTVGLLFGGGAIIGADMVLRIAKATAGVE